MKVATNLTDAFTNIWRMDNLGSAAFQGVFAAALEIALYGNRNGSVTIPFTDQSFSAPFGIFLLNAGGAMFGQFMENIIINIPTLGTSLQASAPINALFADGPISDSFWQTVGTWMLSMYGSGAGPGGKVLFQSGLSAYAAEYAYSMWMFTASTQLGGVTPVSVAMNTK